MAMQFCTCLCVLAGHRTKNLVMLAYMSLRTCLCVHAGLFFCLRHKRMIHVISALYHIYRRRRLLFYTVSGLRKELNYSLLRFKNRSLTTHPAPSISVHSIEYWCTFAWSVPQILKSRKNVKQTYACMQKEIYEFGTCTVSAAMHTRVCGVFLASQSGLHLDMAMIKECCWRQSPCIRLCDVLSD